MPDTSPTDDDIRHMLDQHVADGKAPAVAAGVIRDGGSSIFAHGDTGRQFSMPDGDTVFEIGSITKVFTGLLLVDMVERNETAFDTAVAALLPGFDRIPVNDDRPQITLLDLATHYSGLPRLPDNFHPYDPLDPYLAYDAAKLHAFLSGYAPPADAVAKYDYSNLGAGLLGHALAAFAGKSYEALLQERILVPLRMANTFIDIPDAQSGKVAQGHNSALQPVGPWNHGSLGGCGAVRSTVADLLIFLTAFIDAPATPLHHAMQRMLLCRRPTGVKDLEISIGWHISRKNGRDIIWHNGMTGGFSSFAGFDAARKTGVAVLSNSTGGADSIGMRILCPA